MGYKKIFLAACMILAMLLLVSGCKTKETTCDQLALELDNRLGTGITGLSGVMVGGTLLDISEPKYADASAAYPAMSPEYLYDLTFQGKDKQATFHFYAPDEIQVPLTEGKFYKFEIIKAYGAVLSMGPHNSMFSHNEIGNIFEPVSCS